MFSFSLLSCVLIIKRNSYRGASVELYKLLYSVSFYLIKNLFIIVEYLFSHIKLINWPYKILLLYQQLCKKRELIDFKENFN